MDTTGQPVLQVAVTETGAMIGGRVPTRIVFRAEVQTTALRVQTVDDDRDEPSSRVTAVYAITRESKAGSGHAPAQPLPSTISLFPIASRNAGPAAPGPAAVRARGTFPRHSGTVSTPE